MTPRVAVIGCGYWGKNLVRNFFELNALKVVCDKDKNKLVELRSLHAGPKVTTEVDEVFEDKSIDAVVIATTSEYHYPLGIEALNSGKDVFVEKPLALSFFQGEELVRFAKEKNRILMVGHLLEYHPAIEKIRDLITQGELGEIHYVYSTRIDFGTFRIVENILWSFAPHDISIILYLLNEMPDEVSAQGGNYLGEECDITLTMMSFKSGARAHIFVSWLNPFKEHKLVLVGSKKMVVFDDTAFGEKLFLFNHEIKWDGKNPTAIKSRPEVLDFNREEPLKIECKHFLDCVGERKKPKTDGENGLRVLKVLDVCQRSLRQKGTVCKLS